MDSRVPDDRIASTEKLAQVATELTDEEVGQVGRIVYALQEKYSQKANNADNLNALRDEALTRLADIGVLATLDPAPCFYGEPPTVEIIGKVSGGEESFDHEKKAYEVRKANARNEDFLGQKERPNKRKQK